MKFISIYLLSTAFLLFTAVSNNDVESTSTFSNQIETEIQDLAVSGADLTVTNFRTTLPFGNSPCPGGPQADGTCNGGAAPTFKMGAIVVNQGTIGLAPGTSFKVQWRAVPAGTIVETINVPANGLPPGGSMRIVSPTFTMPCPAGPPYALNTSFVGVFVDFGNSITECDESNNASAPYAVCHN